ncbi:MAG TPA: fatty acid oxidation complex subunit alpha FadJ [Balneolales bacterium]|nr:fatty acid oxidation complex subunit alpha FadJ [Balneolales bacterium]
MSYLDIEKRNHTAILWLDRPGEKVNTLTGNLITEFTPILDELEQDDDVHAIIMISRKPDTFIAGADLEMLKQMKTHEEVMEFNTKGNDVLDRIDRFQKPVIAAIHGATLGGGLEVALACDYRIATNNSKTKFAFPEVQLGLLPGGGGTQRLPRLIGLPKALDMMLTGRNVYPVPAKRMGLVDELIHHDGLLQAALKIADEQAKSGIRASHKKSITDSLVNQTFLGRHIVYTKARENVEKKTKGNYPAPFKILECVKTGMEKGFKAGRNAEARHFTSLVFSLESKQLVNLFFAMQASKKTKDGQKNQKPATVGILGAGLMGSGICYVSTANAGARVLLKDQNLEDTAHGLKNIWDELENRVKKHAISRFERDIMMSRVIPARSYDELKNCDMVIEAVFEDLDVKHQVLRDTEAQIKDDCIFASNTSSLPITEIAKAAKRPENVVGMHYFSPVPKMPLLEIIKTDKSSKKAIDTARNFGVRQGKNVIVVNDGPGFYTTRILAFYINEAIRMLEERISIEDIDRAMTAFGFPVGPVKLLDEVGLDVGAHVNEVLAERFAQRGIKPSPVAGKMIEAGYKGRKNKKGFYKYDDSSKHSREVNGDVYKFIGASPNMKLERSVIQQRMNLMMVNEALYCLQEGILESPQDGDLGAVLGLGYPPFLGGPFRYVDAQGAKTVLEELEKLVNGYGERFKPAPLLEDLVKSNKTFYKE